MSERGAANHSIQAHLTACCGGHAELSTRQGLACGAITLLNHQFSFGGVFKGEADRAALFDLYGLGLSINDEARRCLGFRHYHAFTGSKALNEDLSVLIGSENAIGVTDKRPVRIGNFELRIGQSHAGIGSTDLADQQISVRHVLKPDSYNGLLTTVSQEDGFRRLNDAISVPRVYLLQNIGACSEPSPNGSSVFSGYFLPDDGTASTGGSTEEF